MMKTVECLVVVRYFDVVGKCLSGSFLNQKFTHSGVCEICGFTACVLGRGQVFLTVKILNSAIYFNPVKNSPVRPNVLFLLTDDQRFDTIGALGNDYIKTPNLDRLVQRGISFDRAHIPGGTVAAVCMPSRAMMHSGRGLFEIEGQGQSIPDTHTTLGECFRAEGYETFGTGKWHNGPDAYARSFSDGADIFFGGMADHWNVPCCQFQPDGVYRQNPVIREPGRNNQISGQYCDYIQGGAHSTDLFADSTCAFLDRRNKEVPFFAYVSFMAPHDPRTMPKEYLELYDPERIELPPNFQEAHPIDTGALRVRDELLASHPRKASEIKRHVAEYAAMITHLDAAIGRILEKLDESGDAENTIIVLAGDNGLAIGQHGLMGKQSLYDHSVRVPLIFSGPGIPRDCRSQALCYLSNIFPTICDLCAIDIPQSVTFQSLRQYWTDPEAPSGPLYLAYCDSIRGVSDGHFKLIEYKSGDTQLFDLRHDPWETKNLAEDPGQGERVNIMRQQLAALRVSSSDSIRTEGTAFWESRKDLVPIDT